MNSPLFSRRILPISFFLSFWLVAPGTQAVDLYWDPLVGSPNGSWDTISSNWSASQVGGAPALWLDGSSAIFSASSVVATGDIAVSLATTVAVGDLTYTLGDFGSTLRIGTNTGATIAMAAALMNVNVDFASVLSIAPAITGPGTLVLGDGNLILTGTNTYSGGTTITAGTLTLGDETSTGSIIGAVINNDTFDLFNANTAGITTLTNNVNSTTNFLNATAAGTTTIVNLGGFTAFFNTSTADRSIIVNNGGFTEFFDTATAGLASITNNSGGFTEFFDNSSAGRATIVANNGGETEFNNNSTAAAATIINNSGGLTRFSNTSTAGTSSIANNGGETGFFDNSTAGNADLTNNTGGRTGFNDASSAGNATITTNNGGSTVFLGTSTAAGSSIVTNLGGATIFLENSTGGAARLVTNLGGIVDLSGLSTLGMTAGSIEGAGAYHLGSKILAVGGNNLSTEVSGIISDGGLSGGTGGALIKVGTGTLTVSGANTYSGGTVINLGTLLVNNAQALGTGNVIVNGGVLAADPQPINVLGNYTQNAGGTLQLNVAGSAAGQFDVLNVTGNAALDGTLRLLNLGYHPQNGDSLRLVTTGGTISGRFAQFQNPFTLAAGFNTIQLVYARDSVTLEFLNVVAPVPPPVPNVIVTTDFASFALSLNQSAVATALNRVQSAHTDGRLIDFLNREPFANLPGDFDQISPDSLSALYEISFSAANIQAANLEERFSEIRNGSNGFSSSLSLSNAPQSVVESKDGKAVLEPSKNVLLPSPENKWGVWISGNGDYVNVSGDGNGHGYDFTTGGVTFGLDYRLTSNLAVGIAAGYAHTWTNLTGSGNIDADSGKAGLYASFYQDGFYLSGYVGGGYNSYDTRRETLGGAATGSSNGGEFDGYLGGGYEFHCGGFTFGPIASVQYTYVDISGSNESGSLVPLHIQSNNQDSLRSNLGLSASYTTRLGKVLLTPSVRASWQHEYSYSALPVTAQFGSGAGSDFTVYGPSVGQDSAIVNAGINVQWTPTIGTYVGYNGQLGRDRYDSQGGVCSVHWSF